MKHINIKALLLATVASIFIAIIISVLDSYVSQYAESQLFGNKGAYSHEDKLAILKHPSVMIFGLSGFLFSILLPIIVAAIIAKNQELSHAFYMAVLGSIYSYFTFASGFSGMEIMLAKGYTIISLVLALPAGYAARKYNNFRENAYNKSSNLTGANDAPSS